MPARARTAHLLKQSPVTITTERRTLTEKVGKVPWVGGSSFPPRQEASSLRRAEPRRLLPQWRPALVAPNLFQSGLADTHSTVL